MNKKTLLLALSQLCFFPTIYAENDNFSKNSDIGDMSLDMLLQQQSSLYYDSKTASGTLETIKDAPAAMVVIDAQTIKRRGYDSLDDILHDLPGFDTIVTNGTMQTVAYQRGYRTPWTQRTLFLVNGKVDNNLWNHSAQISRQYPVNIIERIEVLYGPAGAVYGPNAFLGVINVITRDARNLADGESYLVSSFQAGSFDTQSIDIAAGGREGHFSYSFGGKLFSSDEASIEDYAEWGYTQEHLLSNVATWGAGIGAGNDPATGNPSPVGDTNVDGIISPSEQFGGQVLGKYADPTDDLGLFGEINYKNVTLGFLNWTTDEGYGPYYSFLDAQPNASWVHESRQIYLEHTKVKSEKLSVDTELVYRESRVGGDWIESFGDFVSISDWNAYNTAWRFEQKYHYKQSSGFSVNGGIKFESKDLTKTYMICNYYDGTGVCPAQAANSSDGISSDGSGVIAASAIDSNNPSTFPPSLIDDEIPSNNRIKTRDIGGYIQGIWNKDKWRFNASVRVDDNSEYGTEFNPRGAIIFHDNPKTTYKFIYGEAFQEPSPKDLYGGFSGRLANPDLKPEKVRNLEFIMMHQGKHLYHDMSLFYALYDDAIAGGQNVGERTIYGFEYRGRYRIANFISQSSDITGNFYYTYTMAESEQQFDNVLGEWVDDKDDQGDIAPHKVNYTINIPVKKNWNVSLAANWLSSRDLFSQNPLRADSNAARVDNRKAESYTRLDMNLLYENQDFSVGFKIENLTEEEYLLPGVEGAASGDDFNVDVDGFQNSLIPQVKERFYLLNISVKL